MGNLFDMSGNQLRHWAKVRQLSGKEIARLRGIRPETVSRHMNDRHAMSQVDFAAYADILDVDVASLVSKSTPTPVFGVLDRSSFVHQRHASQPALIVSFGGPSAIGSVSIAVLQPKSMVRPGTHDFSRLTIDDVKMDGCFFVHAASLTAQEISDHCFTRLCMVSAKISGEHQWYLGYLYPEPGNSGPGRQNIASERRYTVSPYWPTEDSRLLNGLEIEAAAPVLAKVYAPEVVGYQISEEI